MHLAERDAAGFRRRGDEVTRLMASTDAAWALPDRPVRWQVAAPGLIYFLMFLQVPLLARAARYSRGGV